MDNNKKFRTKWLLNCVDAMLSKEKNTGPVVVKCIWILISHEKVVSTQRGELLLYSPAYYRMENIIHKDFSTLVECDWIISIDDNGIAYIHKNRTSGLVGEIKVTPKEITMLLLGGLPPNLIPRIGRMTSMTDPYTSKDIGY